MTHPQQSPTPGDGGDRAVTWRDLAVYGHGILTTTTLHSQVGWSLATAAAVGMSGAVTWELLRRRPRSDA